MMTDTVVVLVIVVKMRLRSSRPYRKFNEGVQQARLAYQFEVIKNEQHSGDD
jgi:hypothetical protein